LEGADRNDRIVAMIPVSDLEQEDRNLVFLSRQGLLKRTALTEFSNPRAGGIRAAGLKDDDTILDVVLSDGTAELILLSRGGRAIRFPEDDVSVFGRTAQGVKGMGLRDGDEVVGLLLIRRDATVLLVSEDGLGKRTPVSEFPLQKRGGLGTLVVPGDAAAPIVSALEVVDSDELMVVTATGEVTRVKADVVPVQGRRTQGRRIVAVAKGDRIVEVTRAQSENDDPSGGELDGARDPDDPGDSAVAEDFEEDTGVSGVESDPEDQLDLLG
jgi:DNA gyrase subunit A